MNYNLLGDSDVKVSSLTLGCWSFGGDAQSYWGTQSQREVNRLVDEALDRGVNFFDTAFVYNDGASEISLGKALAGKREKAILCNKIPIVPFDALASYEDKIIASLKRLDTDYIDILMIHWPTRDEQLLRANLEVIEKVRRRGLIRHIGFSNFGVHTLDIAGELGIRPIVNELVYNLISRGIEKEILPYCIDHGIGVISYMPLMQGILTGKYKAIEEIPALRRRTIHFRNEGNTGARHTGPGVEAELMTFLDQLRILSGQIGIKPGELAIAWQLAKKGISSVIAGSRNVRQLRENIRAAETPLTTDVILALDKAGEIILNKLGPNADLWEDIDKSRVW